MLKLRVVQAAHGDCLVLESRTASRSTYVLVDGGPGDVYDLHLRGELRKIKQEGGRLDLVILSHVDNDHVVGLRDLFAELEEQRANRTEETVAIDSFWHNAFGSTIGKSTDVEPRLKALLASAGAARHAMTSADVAVRGIGEGDLARRGATQLGIPVNPDFPGDLISVDQSPTPIVVGDFSLRIVGPTEENLEELRKQWLDWLDEHEGELADEDAAVAAMADRSVPNLSSIMILAESEGKTILLTGDGRGDHLLQGLDRAGLLGADGTLHVDVLKVPHHGSDRNVTMEFFELVTADVYVISADGKHGNPDSATLHWIVEAAKAKKRPIEVFVTNETATVRELLEECEPAEYCYRLIAMEKESHSMVVGFDS